MRVAAAIVVLTAPVWGAACGNAVPVPKKNEPVAAGPCPKGTEFVRAREFIGPPPAGFEVVPGDRKALRSFAVQFKEAFEDQWRGYDAQVLVRRDEMNGTAVLIINAHEETEAQDKFLEGAMAAERETGSKGEPIRIAGKDGRMQRAPDGAYIGMAPAGTCSVVVLAADTEKILRDGAAALPSQ